MSDPSYLQEIIRSWMDFGWELLAHPLITFFLGVFGGAHIDGGVRRLWGKGTKATVTAVNKINPLNKKEP